MVMSTYISVSYVILCADISQNLRKGGEIAIKPQNSEKSILYSFKVIREKSCSFFVKIRLILRFLVVELSLKPLHKKEMAYFSALKVYRTQKKNNF